MRKLINDLSEIRYNFMVTHECLWYLRCFFLGCNMVEVYSVYQPDRECSRCGDFWLRRACVAQFIALDGGLFRWLGWGVIRIVTLKYFRCWKCGKLHLIGYRPSEYCSGERFCSPKCLADYFGDEHWEAGWHMNFISRIRRYFAARKTHKKLCRIFRLIASGEPNKQQKRQLRLLAQKRVSPNFGWPSRSGKTSIRLTYAIYSIAGARSPKSTAWSGAAGSATTTACMFRRPGHEKMEKSYTVGDSRAVLSQLNDEVVFDRPKVFSANENRA